MTLPRVETKTWRRRSKCIEASARVMPGLRRSSVSTASRVARFWSTGMVNGSMRQGETQTASYLSSGASATSCLRAAVPGARDLERQARRRVRCLRAVRSSVAAKPQQPPASTRIPRPMRFGAGDVAGLAVLGGDVAVARLSTRARRRSVTPRPRRRIESAAQAPGLSSRRDQPAELVLLARGAAREARGIGFQVLQARAGVVDDDAVACS